MILHRTKNGHSPAAYGVNIPTAYNKAGKTLQVLKSDRFLSRRIQDWYRTVNDETVSREDLLRVHSAAYVNRLFSDRLEEEIMRTYELKDEHGFTPRYRPQQASRPLKELLDRALTNAAGTYRCCRLALESDFCFFLGGGAHHGQRDYGNGFCLVNDIMIAVRKLQAEGLAKTVWIIDVDVHKGDGTAALTQGDPSVVTLSIHMAKGWPLDGEAVNTDGTPNLSFVSSDIDIPVDSGEEHRYVRWLREGLKRMESFPRPDLAVVVSGVDTYEKDELPSTSKLKLTKGQLKSRDRMVYSFLTGRGIPRAYLMAGGYGKWSWEIYTQFLLWALKKHLRRR
jgi:acetoin utilization deacetylase AcuC-like enzyme